MVALNVGLRAVESIGAEKWAVSLEERRGEEICFVSVICAGWKTRIDRRFSRSRAVESEVRR